MTRSSHPSLVLEAAQTHDKAVKSVLATVLPECSNATVTPDMAKQASLPLRMGGLGLTSAVATSTGAYIASFGDAARTVSSRCDAESLACLQRFFAYDWPKPSTHPAPPKPRPAAADDGGGGGGGGGDSRGDGGRGMSAGGAKRSAGETVSSSSSKQEPAAPTTAQEVRPRRTYRSVKQLLDGLHAKWEKSAGAPGVSAGIARAPRTFDDLLSFKRDAALAPGLQHALTSVQHLIDLNSLKGKSAAASSRLTSLGQKGAPDVFVAVPSDQHLELDDDALALKVALTLGCPATSNFSAQQATSCKCRSCGPSCVTPSQHILNCRLGGAPQLRHDAVKEEINQMFRRAVGLVSAVDSILCCASNGMKG